MRFNKILFFSLIASLSYSCCEDDPKDSLQDGLIAYYPFNGNANDASGNKLDGTVHNASLTTDRKGKANSAYSFDGSTSYINVAHHDTLNLSGDFTISLWVEISSEQVAHEGINDILRKWNGDTAGYPFSISFLNPVASDDQENKMLWARYDGSVCSNITSKLTSVVTRDIFLHYVIIKKGTTTKQYINNTLVAENIDEIECSTNNTADLTIGCRGNLVRYFKGKIDDIRIYDRAITDSEILKLYQE